MTSLKKFAALVLAVMMLASMTVMSASAEGEEVKTYYVAGSAGLCGSDWAVADPANAMTIGEGDIYTKVFTSVPAGEYTFKVTQGDWDLDSYGAGAKDFAISVSDTCDVTITFNSKNFDITATGEFVTVPETDKIVQGWYAVGSPELFGENWAPAAKSKMELVNGIYTVTFTNVDEGDYSFKVVETSGSGAISVWHPDGMGNNSLAEVPEDGCTVRICLVPTGNNSEDAPYAEIFAPGAEIPELTEPPKPTQPTEAPTEPPTVAEGKLGVDATSNFGAAAVAEYDTTCNETVTVRYSLEANKPIANAQGVLYYDSTILQLQSFTLSDKFDADSVIINTEIPDKATFNFTNIDSLADLTQPGEFAEATFKILDTGFTKVELKIDELNTLVNDVPTALITDGAIAENADVRGTCDISEPIQPEVPTEAPTEAPTQAPTKAPALSATKKTVNAGSTYTIKVKNTKAKATFSSNKKTVATVDKNGKITALKKGTATITVKVAGKKLTFKLTVKNSAAAKVGKKALKKSYNLKKGKTLSIKLYRKAAAIKNIYTSSNKKIAKVISNTKATTVKIKAYKKGTAKIKIKVNKVTTFTVTIKVK